MSLADFAQPLDSVDPALLFKAALDRLRPGGGVLHIPPGVWRFSQTDGVAVDVAELDDLTIEGHHAQLLFDGRVKPFVFTACRAPTVRGVTIDWVHMPFSQGEVIQVGGGNLSADVRIDPDGGVDRTEAVAALATYDRDTGLMTRGGLDAYDVVDGVTWLGAKRVRLAFKRFLPLHPGETVVLRQAIYGANAFSFARCSDIVVEDVTIRTAPGMGVYADHCQGATVRGLHIARPPGSARLMTTTADGIHFNTCAGRITVADCALSGMGDDGVNIHGKYFRITGWTGMRTLEVAVSAAKLASPLHATPSGDQLDIVAADTLQTRGTIRIVGAEASSTGTTLHLDRDLPSGISAGDYVFDAGTRSEARIVRCQFHGHRARGVLAHSDALIDGCTFSGQSAEAILLLPDRRWMEGPAAERVAIRGNQFSGPMQLNRPSGAIRLDVAAGEGSPHSVNHEISITGNHFTHVGGPVLMAASTGRLLFGANRTDGASDPMIALRDVEDVRIEDNVCTPGSHVAVGISDAANVTMARNIGMALSVA